MSGGQLTWKEYNLSDSPIANFMTGAGSLGISAPFSSAGVWGLVMGAAGVRRGAGRHH